MMDPIITTSTLLVTCIAPLCPHLVHEWIWLVVLSIRLGPRKGTQDYTDQVYLTLPVDLHAYLLGVCTTNSILHTILHDTLQCTTLCTTT